jgi:hypothetical protein
MTQLIKGINSATGLSVPVKVSSDGTVQTAVSGSLTSAGSVTGSVFRTPFPSTPIVTVYTPTGTAYMKVTPTATALNLVVRPRTITENLVYAPLVTHKIADTTNTIAANPITDLPEAKTAVDELLADCNLHIASLTYHIAAGTAFYSGHKATDATNTTGAADMGLGDLAAGYTLYDELKADLTAHAASVVFHTAAVAVTPALPATPSSETLLVAATNALRLALIAHAGSVVAHSVADVENVRLVTATAADAVDTAGCRTNLNLFKAYWNSHVAIGAAAHPDLPAVIVGANAAKVALLAHMLDSSTAHGGTADATNRATLNAVANASDLATALTLLLAEKATYNAHCAVLEGGAYITAGPVGLPIEWPCLGSFFCKTSGPGVFTVAEFRSV